MHPLPDDWCAWHNRSEPTKPGDIVCGECWHTFTPTELIEAHNAWGGTQVTTVDEIHSCPLCAHDF